MPVLRNICRLDYVRATKIVPRATKTFGLVAQPKTLMSSTAFDSIEWNYLFSSLEAFNFGPEFIRWTRTFYKNVSSCIINNGLSSSSFNVKRGVRQGDPLSPYLFVVAIEILTISLRSNDSIKGIKIDDNETKILAYADDMTAILYYISSARKLLETLNEFEKCSAGLKINTSKTKAMWIGANKNSSDKTLGLEWCTGVKNLGIYFSCNQEEVTIQTFNVYQYQAFQNRII